MFDVLSRFLDADSLSPHGICLLWRPELIWTHAISDALIGLSYYSIPVALAYFVSKRTDVVFSWVFWAFAAFILACGTTHFFSIWTLWVPDYGAEALVKVVTAAVSVATAIAVWPLLPKALALPSPAQLRMANADLERRIAERDMALAQVQHQTAERIKAEEMLRQAQKMEALGHLTAGIAHDFNNLLTAILGNLEIVALRHPDMASIAQPIRNAQLGAERAAQLTQQLLAFGRKQSLMPAAFNVNETVQDALDLLGRTLGDNIVVSAELSPDLPPAFADPNQLQNALLNLAVNARDAMPEGGTLTIRTGRATADEAPDGPEAAHAREEGHDFLTVEVTDTGQGMSAETAARAFEPFFTTKPVGHGSGLGLSQVHGFITQSGGCISLESAPGQGTRVRLYLPQAQRSLSDNDRSSHERAKRLPA
jgi:signal transduction histidine kinase